ncbi:MAG: hypothetical protein ACRELY_30690, partial [Polyangiaceae bacterium]
ACSSDDSSTTDGGTTDAGGTDSIAPLDSGPKDSGKDANVACATCSQILSEGLSAAGTPCDESLPLVLALVDCTCAKDPITMAVNDGGGLCDIDSGTGDCAALCAAPTTTSPNGACVTCATDQCTAEFAACAEDGADASAPVDAGADADAG